MSSSKIEMVAASPANDDNPTIRNGGTDHDDHDEIIHNHVKSQLSSSSSSSKEEENNLSNSSSSSTPPRIRNTNTPPPNAAYENWSCDDDDNHNRKSKNKTNDADAMDELAWKIISAVLKGWFIIWILFAILVITAEILSPTPQSRHSSKKNHHSSTKVTVEGEEEQFLFEISEHIVTSCSYSNLDTEGGREECQSLCRNHMCCFFDDDGGG
eukprot:CAMPEP_0183747428 /NCGR_PEP_ID=MMETSP0737-20130205/67262_1 /TAXON_ID=385413 /ORGANISM="Thalassiosira miniscula, Strain CCMP1093" /LENGTH=211 /DNA_ID=CAMNT_0025983141 /DNA_START=214 /DNA_END=846 /DNA_ORIENTATION=-